MGRHYAVAAPSYTSAWRQAAGLVTVLSDRLRFKTHNIGSLATTINRGYCGRDTRLNCGPLRSVSSSDAGKTTAELKVRIQLPPAASPLRTDFPAGSKGRTQDPRGAHEPLTQIKQFLSAAHHLLSK